MLARARHRLSHLVHVEQQLAVGAGERRTVQAMVSDFIAIHISRFLELAVQAAFDDNVVDARSVASSGGADAAAIGQRRHERNCGAVHAGYCKRGI